MLRRAFLSLLTVIAVLVGLSPRDAHAADPIKLKFGTLAPAASPWGQVFKVWEKAVKEKSGGRLELQFFYNGQQGDEGAMVAKMKSGQLQGAAVSAVGLSKIYKPILAVQMPGLFTEWSKLDAALDVMKPEFEKGVSDNGFALLGWGHVGRSRLMQMVSGSEAPVKVPSDLKGRKPYMWREDVVGPVLFQAIGGVTAVPLNIPEVLPQLNTGAVNVVTVPSLVAEQLQWAPRLSHISDTVSWLNIGAIVMSSKAVDGLPDDLKTILRDTGKVAGAALTQRIKDEDERAYERLKGKMKVISLTQDEKNKWNDLFKQVRQRLSQGTFPADLVAKLESLAK